MFQWSYGQEIGAMTLIYNQKHAKTNTSKTLHYEYISILRMSTFLTLVWSVLILSHLLIDF